MLATGQAFQAEHEAGYQARFSMRWNASLARNNK
jgi:hypothetical protein